MNLLNVIQDLRKISLELLIGRFSHRFKHFSHRPFVPSFAIFVLRRVNAGLVLFIEGHVI